MSRVGGMMARALAATRSTAYSLFWNTLTKGSGVRCHSTGHTGSRPASLCAGSSASQTWLQVTIIYF